MNRLRMLFGLLFLLVLSLPHTGQAAGRLNFMLTNLTGLDIIDVVISPTSYPNSRSENLLKTNLDPNTRLYIGPNYYGEQRYWNIAVQWSNGYKMTFTHNQLTRYNSYTVYADNRGVRMRQGFEQRFARYDSGPAPTMLAGSQPNVSVSVGVPEKVNVTGGGKLVADAGKANVGKSKRRSRDLVFEDSEDTGDTVPRVEGTDAADAKGEVIALKTTVELTRDGATSTVLPTEEFKSGDKVRLLFSANRDGFVYWLTKGTSGQYQVLYPSAKAGMDNAVAKNKEYTVPAKGAWRFDDKKGTETLVCMLSPNRIESLDKAVQLAGEGKNDESSQIIAAMIDSHEKKRTSRDLVFEEENENDVNTKTQVADGKEAFVATYELEHQ